jgi:transposase-like protein
MSKSVLNAPHFHDEAAAYAFVEARVWPNGPVCPKCGGSHRIGKLAGKSTRPGVYKCYQCRKPFTVKVGTIFESSHIELHVWLQAMFLMASSKKGVSANQLHRTLGVTLKTAWFLAHRLREAMKDDGSFGPLGGEGKIIEVDETYLPISTYPDEAPATFVNGKGWVNRQGPNPDAMKVVTVVERKGRARSMKVDKLTASTVSQIVLANADTASRLMTDESKIYPRLGKQFAKHETVNHSQEEYARGDVSTNTVEGYFSVFKRGMRGTYQHCAEWHLQRYLAEFDFRYSNRIALGVDDLARTDEMVKGVVGKRLTYQTVAGRIAAEF